MTKPTGNKRGRPPKLPDFMVRLGEDKEAWSEWLSSMGFPKHSSSKYEILEHMLYEDGESVQSALGDREGDVSRTLTGDPWYEHLLQDDADDDLVLPTHWLRYLEYMDVVAEELSPEDKGAAIKKLALDDARSRRDLRPMQFPAEIGSPAEFKKRLAGHELEIRLKADRHNRVISIRFHQLPADEEEDLEPSEEPGGYWEGLKWFPHGKE